MASRKTYFGIGLPKDPTDPESGPVFTGSAAPEDRSSPTVVDDEKVAEGLAQLRNWYSGDGAHEGAAGDGPLGDPPAPAKEAIPLGLQARPTAVGHATAPPAAAVSRPAPPDPMRATMYGHDVHRFDLEIAMARAAAIEQAEAPPATTTDLVLATQALEQRLQEVAPVEPAPRSPSGSFPLAPQGEAQRLQRPGGVRRTPYTPPRSAARVPLTSRIMFGAGALALAGAIVIWLQTDNGSDSTAPAARPPAPAPLAPTPAAALPREPIAPPAPRPGTPAESTLMSPGAQRPNPPPARSVTAPFVAPRRENDRRPAALVTARRHPTTKVEDGNATDDGDTAAEALAPTATGKETTPVEAIPLLPDHPRKRVEGAPEAPPRKKSEAGKAGEPQRGKVRIGTDGDETLPPSED